MNITLLLGAVLALACGASSAQSDPFPQLPPAQRSQGPSPVPAASGDALHKQALQKLRRRFEEADLDANGQLTEEEAKRAGLGFISGNFAAIDSSGSGKVSFADVQKFLEQRRK